MPKKQKKNEAESEITTYADIIGKIIEQILLSTNTILRNAIIQFLTLNFYRFLITDMNILFKFQIYAFLTSENLEITSISKDKILDNLEIIEYNTKKLILDKNFKRYFIHHYRYILNRDIELLQHSILVDVEKSLYAGVDIIMNEAEAEQEQVEADEVVDESDYPYKSSICICLNCFICTDICCPNLLYEKPKQGKKRSCWGSAKIPGSFINNFIKSISGYSISFFFVFVLYCIMRYIQNTAVEIGVVIICGLGSIILFGLSFNSTIRAYVFLMVPWCASFNGRVLISYLAYKTARVHIYGNYEINTAKLKFTFGCMKKLIYDQIMKLSDIGGFIGFAFKIVKKVIEFCEWAGEAIATIKEFITEILAYIQEAFKLIFLLTEICSDQFGKPMMLCFDFIQELEDDKCSQKTTLLSLAGCYLSMYAFRAFCLLLLYLQYYCTVYKLLFKGLLFSFKFIVSAVWDAVLGNTFGKFEDVFDISFNASREYYYFEHQDKSMYSIVASISQEYKYRIEYVIFVLRSIDYVFPVMIIYMIYESWSYKNNFMNHIEFDNFMLSVNFEKIDKKRFARNYRTLLPLRQGLKEKYVRIGSFNKTKLEEKRTGRAIAMFIILVIPIAYMIGMDQMMISVYSFVIKHAYVKTDLSEVVPGTKKVGLRIEGEGFIASIYKFLFTQFSEIAKSNITVDSTPCVPPVSKMKDDAYTQVAIYTMILLVASFGNSYILRLRSVIMGSVYTQRDEERAIWLYNHIIVHDRHFFFSPLMAIREKVKQPCLLWIYIKGFFVCIIDLIKCLIGEALNLITASLKCFARCPCWAGCCIPFCFACDVICSNIKYLNPLRCVKVLIKYLKNFITFLCLNFNAISCEFCSKKNLGLEFQTCLNDICQRVFCFECYSRFYNECPFCILRSKNKNGDEDEDDIESLEADSSDEELVVRIKDGKNEDDDDDDDDDELEEDEEVADDEEQALIKKGVVKKVNANKTKNNNNNIFSNENFNENASSKVINKNQNKAFVSELYGNHLLYIKALNRIQGKKLQRSVLKPRKDTVSGIITEKLEYIFEMLNSEAKYEYTLKNFKTVILAKKEIHDLFNRYSIDLYNDVGESVFDNIVGEIELEEYFNVRNEVNGGLYNYLDQIKESLVTKK
jgi:hypothetical protein